MRALRQIARSGGVIALGVVMMALSGCGEGDTKETRPIGIVNPDPKYALKDYSIENEAGKMELIKSKLKSGSRK